MIKDREEEKKQELKQRQTTDSRLEYNNNHHMNELIKEILAYNKTNGYDEFEETSMYIKKKMTKLSFQFVVPGYIPKRCIELTPNEENIFRDLNKKKGKSVETVDNYIEDILSLSRIMEWGGISFSKNEWFKIRLAMKKLLIESDAVSLKFWGKIYGLNADYYVIQGSVKQYPMGNPKPHVESKGNEGLNKYTFWVTNSVMEGWYELPDITNEHIIASKNFKYYFTGNLNAKVRAFNNFNGKEAHLLKCQILRIMHSSFIVPEGYHRINEKFQEDLAGKVTEFADGEFQPGQFEDMKTEDKWIHEHPYIYPNGKVIDPSQEAQVERMKKITEDEGFQKLDKEGNPEEVKYWKVKSVGDQMQYTKESGAQTYATILITNTRWPGSNCIWRVR